MHSFSTPWKQLDIACKPNPEALSNTSQEADSWSANQKIIESNREMCRVTTALFNFEIILRL